MLEKTKSILTVTIIFIFIFSCGPSFKLANMSSEELLSPPLPEQDPSTKRLIMTPSKEEEQPFQMVFQSKSPVEELKLIKPGSITNVFDPASAWIRFEFDISQLPKNSIIKKVWLRLLMTEGISSKEFQDVFKGELTVFVGGNFKDERDLSIGKIYYDGERICSSPPELKYAANKNYPSHKPFWCIYKLDIERLKKNITKSDKISLVLAWSDERVFQERKYLREHADRRLLISRLADPSIASSQHPIVEAKPVLIIDYIETAPIKALSRTITIGIAPFYSSSDSNSKIKAISEMFPQMLINELTKRSSKIRIVERQRLKKILEEIALGITGLISDTKVVEAGRMISAQIIITGTISVGKKLIGRRIKDTGLEIHFRGIETETGRLLFSETISGSEDSIISAVNDVAEIILKHLRETEN